LRTVRASEEVYERLKRIMEENRLPSLAETLRYVVEEYEKHSIRNAQSGTGNALSGHPLNSVSCRARRITAKAFISECSDGRKAFVPYETLVKLVERFGDIIEILDAPLPSTSIGTSGGEIKHRRDSSKREPAGVKIEV